MFNREFIVSFEDLQTFSTCPDKSRIKMKTCIEHWWNDADRGKTENFREKIIQFYKFAHQKFYEDWPMMPPVRSR